jgi:signal transduction histidine kinase
VLLGLSATALSGNRRKLKMIKVEAARMTTPAGTQAGILEERQRLAGEIHDTLAQSFTSVVLHRKRRAGPERDRLLQRIEQARSAHEG